MYCFIGIFCHKCQFWMCLLLLKRFFLKFDQFSESFLRLKEKISPSRLLTKVHNIEQRWQLRVPHIAKRSIVLQGVKRTTGKDLLKKTVWNRAALKELLRDVFVFFIIFLTGGEKVSSLFFVEAKVFDIFLSSSAFLDGMEGFPEKHLRQNERRRGTGPNFSGSNRLRVSCV